MFNLTSRITRFFSWIKTGQDHQNNLIVQQQLGNVLHQVVIDQSPIQTTDNSNNNNTNHRVHDEADITTSFDNSSNLNNTNTIDTPNLTNSLNHSHNRIVESSPMQYQPSSSLLLGKNMPLVCQYF